MAKRWIIRKYDADLARSVSVSARIPELLASLLVSRGIRTADAAQAFLGANLKDHLRDPFLLPGCREVAQRLIEAVSADKKIVVYGDYDVDGITGTVILLQTLKDLGAKVEYYVPSRLDEGYGLNSEAIQKLLSDHGAAVIITVDCGISSIVEADLARELGVELLITDHHTPGTVLPDAAAIAHPQLVRFDDNLVSPHSLSPKQLAKAESYPFPPLCGSTVALKVAWGLAQLAAGGPGKPASPALRKRLTEMVGLAVMGTVADFVPLLDENRALVRSGLQFLQPSVASTGLKDLLAISKYVEGRTQLDAEFIAFQLAPRLNAAGRLCQASLAVELLTSDDKARTAELADYINNLNETRKSLEKKILHEAIRQIEEQFDAENDPAFVLASPDWHKGVIGIVAGRVADRFHRPTVLLGQDGMGLAPAVGSARSVPGFNLYAALEACEPLLVRFGGHDAAAGLTIEDKNIKAFRELFCSIVEERVTEEERTAELFLDGVFPLGAFTRQAVQQISRLAPFGCENAKPVFSAEKVTAINPRPMGKDGSHFTTDFQQHGVTLRAFAFSRKEWAEEMRGYEGRPLDITFKVKQSDFGGKVELDLLDWRPSE